MTIGGEGNLDYTRAKLIMDHLPKCLILGTFLWLFKRPSFTVILLRLVKLYRVTPMLALHVLTNV